MKIWEKFRTTFFPLQKEKPCWSWCFKGDVSFFVIFKSPKVVEIFMLNIGPFLTMRNKLLEFLVGVQKVVSGPQRNWYIYLQGGALLL